MVDAFEAPNTTVRESERAWSPIAKVLVREVAVLPVGRQIKVGDQSLAFQFRETWIPQGGRWVVHHRQVMPGNLLTFDRLLRALRADDRKAALACVASPNVLRAIDSNRFVPTGSLSLNEVRSPEANAFAFSVMKPDRKSFVYLVYFRESGEKALVSGIESFAR